ncbi:hsp70 nucleotide exchange factor fes1 [Dionaea muscipula]
MPAPFQREAMVVGPTSKGIQKNSSPSQHLKEPYRNWYWCNDRIAMPIADSTSFMVKGNVAALTSTLDLELGKVHPGVNFHFSDSFAPPYPDPLLNLPPSLRASLCSCGFVRVRASSRRYKRLDISGDKVVSFGCYDGQGSNSHDKTDARISPRAQKEHLPLFGDSSAHLGESTSMDLESSRLSHVAGEKINDALPLQNNEELNVSHSTQVQQFEKQSKELHPDALRCFVPQVRPRSLSPSANFKDGNKRPAIICDFFAKGWCIKGNSCRFLHQRDSEGLGNTTAGSPSPALQNQQDLLGPEGGPKDESHFALGVHEKDKHALRERGLHLLVCPLIPSDHLLAKLILG